MDLIKWQLLLWSCRRLAHAQTTVSAGRSAFWDKSSFLGSSASVVAAEDARFYDYFLKNMALFKAAAGRLIHPSKVEPIAHFCWFKNPIHVLLNCRWTFVRCHASHACTSLDRVGHIANDNTWCHACTARDWLAWSSPGLGTDERTSIRHWPWFIVILYRVGRSIVNYWGWNHSSVNCVSRFLGQQYDTRFTMPGSRCTVIFLFSVKIRYIFHKLLCKCVNCWNCTTYFDVPTSYCFDCCMNYRILPVHPGYKNQNPRGHF